MHTTFGSRSTHINDDLRCSHQIIAIFTTQNFRGSVFRIEKLRQSKAHHFLRLDSTWRRTQKSYHITSHTHIFLLRTFSPICTYTKNGRNYFFYWSSSDLPDGIAHGIFHLFWNSGPLLKALLHCISRHFRQVRPQVGTAISLSVHFSRGALREKKKSQEENWYATDPDDSKWQNVDEERTTMTDEDETSRKNCEKRWTRMQFLNERESQNGRTQGRNQGKN